VTRRLTAGWVRPRASAAAVNEGRSATSEGARSLTVHLGPTFEEFVAATAGEGDDIADPPRLTEIAAAHGIDIVGPRLVP
jgi:hypothetical protein